MKNNKRTSLLLGSFITLIICISPYLLYIHNNIPDNLTEVTIFSATIKAGYYQSVQTFVYFVFSKFVPLLLLLIWFVTNKHWWVHAIIIPISIYLFQLISVINDSGDYVDKVEFIYTVPITVIVVLILYFLRSKLSIFIQAVDLKKEMDETMGGDF